VTEPRPCSAVEAVTRALSIIDKPGGQYLLGTGGYRPYVLNGVLIDRPWTQDENGSYGTDCAGFALSWCYKLHRSRPGYNKGGAFDIEDDINSNSAIGDAVGARDLFELADGMPKPGDCLVYPTFRLNGLLFIGHAAIVVDTSRATSWDPKQPRYDLLDIAQSHGPNHFQPGVVRTDASVFEHHLLQWPRPEQTVYMLRALP
jgi:hypothetical protein